MTASHRFALILAIVTAPLCAQMAPVPGGSFTMGIDGGEPNQAPAHAVSISPFHIDKTEVTFSQYDSCVRLGACTPAHYDDGACVIWTQQGFRNVRVPPALRNGRYPWCALPGFRPRHIARRRASGCPPKPSGNMRLWPGALVNIPGETNFLRPRAARSLRQIVRKRPRRLRRIHGDCTT